MDLFQIAIANPMRFTPADDTDLFTINQEGKCYFQKWQQSDNTKLQILSTYPDIEFLIRNYQTNAVVGTIPVVEIPVNIINQPDYPGLKCYQVSIPFASLPVGQYFAEITYSGVSGFGGLLYSEPFDVAVVQPQTLLVKYKNSENNFSIIFDTNIEFDFRVEGTIKDFAPQFDDVIYNDQKRNATLLNSVPWRQYTLYFTPPQGLPDWIIDLENSIMSMDQKNIDGVYYEKVEGAKWEQIREVEYPFSGMKIEIMPVENVFLQRIKTGDPLPDNWTITEMVKNYFNNAANLTVEGVFSKYSLLKHITTINYGIAFTMLVGTTPGGSDIGTFDVPAGSVGGTAKDDTVNWAFVADTDVYLTGLTGTNCDILFNYLQYDAQSSAPIPAPPVGVPKCSVWRFEEVAPGDLIAAFDLTTGLGKPASGWEDWAIKDGRNGTVAEDGAVPVMYIAGDPVFGTLNAIIGDNEKILTVDELPEVVIPFNYDSVGRDSGSQTTMRNYPGSNTGASITFPGGGQPTTTMQRSIVALWVKKIA